MPQDTSIGKINYDHGLRVAGTINVAGFSGSAKVEIDPTRGVEVAGSLSPVHLGDVFSLTADGSAAGPSLDIQIKTTAVPVTSPGVAEVTVAADAWPGVAAAIVKARRRAGPGWRTITTNTLPPDRPM